ncbi:MAG: nuclear transport factor 2 family protein [Pseudolabrys sp.]
MSDALDDLMKKNLIEVFGQRDFARREAAIAEIYTADCTFFEADERIVGRDALNAKIERILQEAPGFVFRATGRAQLNHDLGRLRGTSDRLDLLLLLQVWTSRSSSTGEFGPCTPFSTSLRAIEEARAPVVCAS